MTEIIFPFSFLNEFHAVVNFALNDSPLMSCNFPFTLPPGLGQLMPCYNCTQKIPGILFIVKVDESFAVYFNTAYKQIYDSHLQCRFHCQTRIIENDAIQW